EAMKKALVRVPVSAKIRLGWNDAARNAVEQARALADGGADAIVVHGRTRNARYRTAADWDAIGEVVSAVAIRAVGNADVLSADDAAALRARSGCNAVMTARAALIRPGIFREMTEGYGDVSADERVGIYRRYVTLAREHWGHDDHGLQRVRQFTRWHLDFWHRDLRPHESGSFPSMQVRETNPRPRSPLDALLGLGDAPALDYLADCLVAEREIVPPEAPGPVPAAVGEGALEEVEG